MTIVASYGSSVSPTRYSAAGWRESMKRAIRDPAELCRRLNLPPELARGAALAARDFHLFAPLEYVARMKPGDPGDPLLRQVLPVIEELEQPAGYSADPLLEAAATASPGLLHKYHGRALMITTGACAVHCRYCFRRHFPYSAGPSSFQQWRPALEAIAADETIEEVLLSGGDPLTLSDDRLQELIGALERIAHLSRLRIHTRLPVVIPSRITSRLLQILRQTRLTVVVVAHFNHPAELGSSREDPVALVLARLLDQGIPVLNQAVLLRGVNDDLETLVQLHRGLINLRVIPYYLHQLDRVRGAAHFETDISRGQRLMEQLRRRLPGYAVPRYVQETPGSLSKMPLSES